MAQDMSEGSHARILTGEPAIPLKDIERKKQMCNIDERERCAHPECGLIFEEGAIKFLVRGQPLHQECFRKYMEKLRVTI